jgi:hypothetical protein
MPLNRGATVSADDLAILAGAGLSLARDGQRYTKRVAGPVNGDYYEYQRVELLDANGHIVGSRHAEES